MTRTAATQTISITNKPAVEEYAATLCDKQLAHLVEKAAPKALWRSVVSTRSGSMDRTAAEQHRTDLGLCLEHYRYHREQVDCSRSCACRKPSKVATLTTPPTDLYVPW